MGPGRWRCIGVALMMTVLKTAPAAAEERVSPWIAATFDQRGIILQSADENFRLKLGGRVQLDAGDGAVRGQDFTDPFNRGELRRLYLEGYGTLWQSVELAFQYNFALDRQPIKDAAIAYRSGPFVITLGNVSEPVGLEELIGANNLTFMESAIPNALVPGAATGVSVGVFGERWSFVGGVFGGNINDRVTDRGTAVAARFAYAPILDKDRVLHLAVSASRRSLDGTELSFSTRPESHLFDASLVNTGTIDGAREVSRLGAEAAWQSGPFRVQSEYLLADVARAGMPDVRFQGAYVEAAWIANAPSGRPYTVASPYGTAFSLFDRMPIPAGMRVSQGGSGVIELAGRFSWLELSDRDIRGGTERNITLGLNWYPEPNIRLTANYVHADAITPQSSRGRVVADILMGRLHIRF